MPESEASLGARALARARAHPVLVALLLLGAVVGAAAAVWLPFAPEGMSLTRRIVGGGIAGLLFAMCALGFRLYES